MADDTNIEDKKVKDDSIFFSYLVVVLFLAVLAVLIVMKALNTAFVEKDRWLALAKTQIMPDRTVLPSRGNIYSFDGKLMATSVPRYYTYLDFKADGFLLDTFLYSKRNGIDSLSVYLSRKFKDRSPAGYKSHLLRGLKSKSRQYPVHVGKVSYSDLKEMKKYPFLRLNRFKSGFYTKEMVDRQRPFGTLAARTIGDVYGEIDKQNIVTRPDTNAVIDAIKRKDPVGIAQKLCNVLELVTIPEYPVLAQIKEFLLQNGSIGALMSGSGPTTYGLFQDEILANFAYRAALEKYSDCDVILCQTKKPDTDRIFN